MCLKGLLFHIFEWVLQAVHSMGLDHINPPPNLPTSCLFCLNLSCTLRAVRVSWRCGLPRKLRAHTIDTCHLTMEFHPGVGLCDYLFSHMLGFCVAWPCAGFVCVVTATVSSNVYVPCCVGEHGFLAVTHCLWLLSSFCLFLWDAPRVFGGRGCHRDVPFSAHPKTSVEMEIDREETHNWGRKGEWELQSAHPKWDDISHLSFWSLLPSHFLSFLVFPLPPLPSDTHTSSHSVT